ncbi:hypothetical protein NDU88_003337 [Pleurodeles waltl]|uniref:Uncharacterized protein n=1 Tax=Pleurodeles waltl TaxID=8319 RepID=A0AAV7MTZ2_PLEWA|nr:hypothetical protein NDU88_003337 [Pleurodeles waltl]
MRSCTAVLDRLPQPHTTPAELPHFRMSLHTGQADAILGGVQAMAPNCVTEDEAGDGHMAAVDPEDSRDEEAEDEDDDNRSAIILQYFK